ncbi:MAG: ABC transporter ATPase [Crocinitomicaceae bacterium]
MLVQLKNSATVWVFQGNQKFDKEQVNNVKTQLKKFIPKWAAHGLSLKADFEIVKDLFIIIGVDEQTTQASGCSKDALTREIKMIGDLLEIDFFDRMSIVYKDDTDSLKLCNMSEFKELLSRGTVTKETIVYNNLVATKQELLTKWETTVQNSWHSNLLITNV